MKRTLAALTAFSWLITHAAEPPKRPVLLTGEVIALDSQPILVPPSNSSPTLLRNFATEGTLIQPGEVILRIDAMDSSNISTQQAELEQAEAKARRETSELAVKAVEAEQQLRTAEAAVKKARIDAALPRTLVSALDFDRYQGELVRTQREAQVEHQALANAQAAVTRRSDDGELEVKKLRFNVSFLESMVAAAEVRAQRAGIVVHTYNEWRGERNDEGSSAFPGSTVGQIIGAGRMQVRAWALEADRPFLAVDQQVGLSFDALPGLTAVGTIERISNAPQLRAAWGNGRYFQIDIALPATVDAHLVAGMSVLVEPLRTAGPTQPRRQHSLPETLQLEGEISSRNTIAVSPPQVPEVWQFTLASLAPEGTLLRAGDKVAVFEAPDLQPKLDSKQSLLKEKQRALDKLELDQREAARAADLDVREAHSNLEKAERKVSQPKEQIRRIDYDKLVIDRDLAQQLAQLEDLRQVARTQARAAERTALLGEIERLQSDIQQLTAAIASLSVTARAPGLVLYRLQFNGEKFAVGSQVWRSISVATLADPKQLLVRATVPEAQAQAVRVGQTARVNVPGANVALPARVSAVGHVYHIKSRAQPVIVRDVELSFEALPTTGVKPGAAVQISLSTSQPVIAAQAGGIASEP